MLLLIVPYWNWNSRGIRLLLRRAMLLIVPYWNWNSAASVWRWWRVPFNRTILELKQFSLSNIQDKAKLLIVPYWNWNAVYWISDKRLHNLLIVPYWNWNFEKVVQKNVTLDTFNRTILELKLWPNNSKLPHQVLLIVPYWNWNGAWEGT